MITRRFRLLIYLVLGLFALSLILLNGGMLALALPFVLYLAAAWWLAPNTVSLEVERSLSAESVVAGKTVEVTVKISNMGSHLPFLYISDQVPYELEKLSGETQTVLALPAGSTTGLEYKLRGRRGKYIFKGVTAAAADPFGLFQRKVELAETAGLLVMPEVHKLMRVPISPRQTRGFAGPLASRQAGSGVDFFGVREYELGDSLRHINWRISTRHKDDLFSNEFEQERIADIGLILDARQQSSFQVNGSRLFDYSVDAAASLADYFITQGHRVSLLVYGFSIERVYAGYGKIQRERIMQSLARANTGFNYALESLYYLPTRLFPTHSQLVMISPLDSDDLPVLVRLRAQGYEVMTISPDPVAFEGRQYQADQRAALARRLAYLERNLLFRKLRQIGVRAVNWPVDQPLEQAVRLAMGQHHLFNRRLENLP